MLFGFLLGAVLARVTAVDEIVLCVDQLVVLLIVHFCGGLPAFRLRVLSGVRHSTVAIEERCEQRKENG